MMEVLHISNEWWAVWAEHIKMQLKQQQLGLQSNFQKDPIARAKAQCIVDDNIRKAMLVSTLQDCALTWYINHSNDHPNAGIVEI